MTIYDIKADTSDKVVLKRGDRARWPNSDGSLRYTKKGLVESLCADGHEATMTMWRSGYYFVAELKCSCGYALDRVALTFGGDLASNTRPVWRSHFNPLAAPVKIWEVRTSRTLYTCYVGLAEHVTPMMNAEKAKSLTEYMGHYRYCVVQTSHVLKSGKQSSPGRLLNRYNNFTSAVQYAKSVGIRRESRGDELTWHEASPVTKPTGEATAIIAAIDQAQDPASIMSAIKLADAYLDYAKVIEERKEAALLRFNGLLDPVAD